MTDQAAVLICLSFALATVILLIATASVRAKEKPARYAMAFFADLLGWQVSEMLLFLLRDARAVHLAYALQLAFIAFLPVTLLWVVAALYRMQDRFSGKRMLLISVVPLLTTIFAITSLWNPLLLQHFSVAQWWPITSLAYTWGPWFYVQLIYSLCLEAYLLSIMLRREKALPRGYRGSAVALLVSVVFCTLATLLEPFRLALGSLDISLLLASLGGIILYVAAFSGGHSDYMQLERKETLDYLDESVFILDKEDKIIDRNEAAARFLKQTSVEESTGRTFDALLEELRAKGKIGQRTGRAQGGEGEDLYVVDTRFQQILQMTRQPLAARGGHSEGAFIILEDVTQNRVLIEQLHAMTGIDPLTGLPNKYQYRTIMRGLDVPENLPVSVVVCLLDGLHKVNAQQGHIRGDEILKTVAAVLTEMCPKGGAVARLSGDQFAVLMPRYSNEAARVIIADTQLRLMQDGIFQGTLATRWGFATKTQPGENLNALRMQAERFAQQDPGNRSEEGGVR